MKTDRNQQPKELGKVSWYRDYDAAIAESSRTNKPVFLLFQEVPGYSNCVNFAHDMLSYPLFVEAIENEFIPLAIYNNVAGEDKKVLEKFNERAWNNPVVRFIDKNGADLVPKLDFSLNPLALYEKMRNAILISSKQVPRYVELLGDELKILHGFSKITYYETPCFWSGETSMIQHPMVLSTEAGWMTGKEVVKVHYDPDKGSLDELNNFAIDQGFYLMKKPDTYKIDVNPQYYLKGSVFRLLPLSFTQRTCLIMLFRIKKMAKEKLI
ncbi:thioredoxin family protein [Niabella ginsengisoli]|uniref:Thioredoxin family protein n=1 Tax=Niabella ginsengisoli TaxID=522298 RepID=A0ABS9SKL1_9BACT|nr:thioredoxin family protein [Niabella ginsengisoli]MCH5598918.1 thioredoxin family protein [Niabella ginsengisoli]